MSDRSTLRRNLKSEAARMYFSFMKTRMVLCFSSREACYSKSFYISSLGSVQQIAF